MTRALFVLLALLCGGCAEDSAEKWLSKDPINTAAVQRVERKVDSLRAEVREYREEAFHTNTVVDTLWLPSRGIR